MKIAVNRCYGGFSISPKALELYYQKKFGKKIYHFKQEFTDNYEHKKYVLLNDNEKSFSDTSFLVDNPNEISGELWKKYYVSNRPEDRACKFLIEAIEELGKQANGDHADIEIVEIPDDVDWEIEEYDGREWVSEKHRTW